MPIAGSKANIDGMYVDGGVVSNCSSVTSTNFYGNITGDVTGDVKTVAASAATSYLVHVGSISGVQELRTTSMTYNGTTDVLTVDTVVGDLTGTLNTAAQPNVTSTGTLTILNVDNLRLDTATLSNTVSNADTYIEANGTELYT